GYHGVVSATDVRDASAARRGRNSLKPLIRMGITIRRCTAGDIADVLQFIDQHWKAGHALVTCPSLLDWQHRDADGRGYSFILARRDNAIVGLLGYIATRRFDPALADDNVIWLTTWKVREDANIAGLGLALLQALTKSERHVAI